MDEPLASRNAQRRIKEAYALPPILEACPMNERSFKERIEFFLGPTTSGAEIHLDAICEPILSYQIVGRKRWSLGLLPPYSSAMRRIKAKDVAMKSKAWRPLWEVEVGPGEALLFPAGVLHATLAVDSEDNAECSVSASLQFRHPFAAGFIKDISQRLMFSSEVSFCFHEVWSVFLTGQFRGLPLLQAEARRLIRKGASENAAGEAAIRKLFAKIDGNKDSVVHPAESQSHFKKEAAKVKNVDPELLEFDPVPEAADWQVVHDINRDGAVSEDELVQSLSPLLETFVLAQAQGSCDEGCDTPLRKGNDPLRDLRQEL